MSMRQVLDIVDALLKDESVGLRATTERLAVSLPNVSPGNPEPVSGDFAFYRGKLPGIRPTNHRGNVMLRPARGNANNRLGGNVREGAQVIDIGFETFGASDDDQVDEATLVLGALRQCLDGLREFSDANLARFGTSIIDVDEAMDYRFGDFDGPTSYGFLATISIQEISSE